MRSEYFPNGGRRHGTSHWRLGVGGTTLLGEGNSDGSVGPLSYLITIWWDKDAKVYYFFTCFKDAGSSCELRGTAHWEGDTFVNDYEEMEQGKSQRNGGILLSRSLPRPILWWLLAMAPCTRSSRRRAPAGREFAAITTLSLHQEPVHLGNVYLCVAFLILQLTESISETQYQPERRARGGARLRSESTTEVIW